MITPNVADATRFAAVPTRTKTGTDALEQKRVPLSYSTQISAPSDLRFVSQPSPAAGASQPGVSEFPDYVYEAHGGAGVWIYYVELGVNTASVVSIPQTTTNTPSDCFRVIAYD